MSDLTVFFLRYTTRAGLGLALTAWWFTRFWIIDAAVQIGPGGLSLRAFQFGWVVASEPPSSRGPTWFCQVDKAPGRHNLESEFDKFYSDLNLYVPGLEYRRSIRGEFHVLLFRHSLVCLMFLTETVATNWRGKPTVVQESERMTENGMNING